MAVGAGDDARAVWAAARRLEDELDLHARPVAEAIHAALPDLPATLAVTSHSISGVRALLFAFARAVQEGRDPAGLVTPEATLEHARMYARRDVDLAVLLRTYRAGHGVIWRLWTGLLDDAVARDGGDRVAARDHSAELLFSFIDTASAHVVDEYRAERERRSRSAEARRAAVVRDLIEGQAIAVGSATTVLGRDPRGTHVGVVAVSGPGGDAATAAGRLERDVIRIAAALGDERPLLVPVGHRRLWAWATPRGDDPLDRALTAASGRGDGAVVALGEPAAGLEGFRLTHREALAGLRVAGVEDEVYGRSIVRWRDVALAGLLGADAELAAPFATRELGELGGDDDASARLRTTLLVYLAEGAHVRRTAERLGLHTNTVGNRLRQCEATLGRPIGERRAALHAALLLREGARAVGELSPPVA
ncbi:MAG: PucR family transcriptional regulator [Solirubrobacteraceae bacterium]